MQPKIRESTLRLADYQPTEPKEKLQKTLADGIKAFSKERENKESD